MFQNTLERFKDTRFEPPLILTSNEYRFIIEEQLDEVGINNSGIIIEPNAKDTAPAILTAALFLNKHSDNPTMLIVPTDHTFGDKAELKSLISTSTTYAQSGEIVTIGIKPDRAETGYGWIKPDVHNHDNSRLYRVINFHEKPDTKKADYYYKSGNYLWNSGIYLVSTETILELFKKYTPKLLNLVFASVQNFKKDLGFIRIDEKSWNNITPISLDFAIVEKVSNLLVAKYEHSWDDLGDWNAVWRENDKDINGMCTYGEVFFSDSYNSYLRSENPNQLLVAIGCKDMVVVSTPDAVLVSKKGQTQDIKMVVNQLMIAGHPQSWQNQVENRPWGKVESLLNEEHLQINRLMIEPGKNIVLQRHSYRVEHWVVAKGTASITLDKQELTLNENQSLNIPMGAKHSLRNLTKHPLIVIEIKTGSRLDIHDIERFEEVSVVGG